MILSLVYIRQILQQYYGKTQWNEVFSALLADRVVGTLLQFSVGNHTHALNLSDTRTPLEVSEWQYSVLKKSTFFLFSMSYLSPDNKTVVLWGVRVSVDDGWKQSETIDRWTLTLEKSRENTQEEEPEWLTHAAWGVDVPPHPRFWERESDRHMW